MITRKLNGGIASIAILNKDHTEVQTKIKRIKRKIGIILLENLRFICDRSKIVLKIQYTLF